MKWEAVQVVTIVAPFLDFCQVVESKLLQPSLATEIKHLAANYGGTGVSPVPAGRGRPALHNPKLFHFYSRAGFRELLLNVLRLFLGDAFFHRLRRAVHQILGLFQTQASDFTNSLDDVDLVGADFLQHDS